MSAVLRNVNVSADPDAAMSRELQLGALELASSTRDDVLLATLTARADACPEILAAAQRSSNVKVLAAYLARPDTTAEEMTRLIRRERRVKVLATIVRSDNTPVALLQQLAADDRKGVMLALLENPNLPRPQRIEIVERLLRLNLTYNEHRSVLAALTDLREAHDRFASDPRTPDDILRVMLKAGALSDDVELATVERLQRAEEAVGGPNVANYLAWKLTKLLDEARSAGTLAHLVRKLTELVDSGQLDTCTARDVAGRLAEFDLDDIDATAARSNRAATSTDPSELAELAELAADADARGDEQRMLRLVRNPNLPVDAARTLLDKVPTHAARDVAARANDAALTAQLCLLEPPSVRHLPPPDNSFGRDVLDRVVARLANDDWRSQSVVYELLRLEWPDVSLADRLPLQLLMAAAHVWPGRYRTYINARLEQVCGSDLSRWQLLHGLADNFAGTFGDLLEAVELLQQRQPPTDPQRAAAAPRRSVHGGRRPAR